LRKKIQDTPVRFDSQKIRFTVSIGLAQFSAQSDESAADLIRRVDDGLYDAKKQGRNRIVAVVDPAEQQGAGGLQAQS
jgi:diguanylate cyclase (GGDEF)-like protein